MQRRGCHRAIAASALLQQRMLGTPSQLTAAGVPSAFGITGESQPVNPASYHTCTRNFFTDKVACLHLPETTTKAKPRIPWVRRVEQCTL